MAITVLLALISLEALKWHKPSEKPFFQLPSRYSVFTRDESHAEGNAGPVVDRPLIQYAVDEAGAGIEEFVFVTGRLNQPSKTISIIASNSSVA